MGPFDALSFVLLESLPSAKCVKCYVKLNLHPRSCQEFTVSPKKSCYLPSLASSQVALLSLSGTRKEDEINHIL